MTDTKMSTQKPEPTVLDTQKRINLLLEEVAKLALEKEKIKVIGPPAVHGYLWVAVALVVAGIVGIAAIMTWRPDTDFLIVSGSVFTFVTITITNLFGYMKAKDAETEAREARFQARETHLAVNSRLDAFIKSAEAAARAQGVQAGVITANARTDELAALAGRPPGDDSTSDI